MNKGQRYKYKGTDGRAGQAAVLVERALQPLPEEFRQVLDNLAIVVEDL